MTYKQSFFLFCITSSLFSYAIPTNSPQNNNYKNQVVQSLQTHPKKTIAGTLLTSYGAKLIYEGSKTLDRLQNNKTYTLIGYGTEIVGGILITIGTTLLFPAIRDALFPNDSTNKTT